MTDARRRWAAAVTLVWLVAAGERPAAYLKLGYRVGTRTVSLRWPRMPVRYFVTDRDIPGVTAPQLQAAAARAFGTWEQVASAQVSATFVGFTGADPFQEDGMSVIGFLDRPEMERVLGATTFMVETTSGEVIEADIYLNSAFPWSVAPTGETGKFDVESILLHEIGHLFGLGHSAIGETELRPTGGRRVIAAESAMFPIAFSVGSIEGRTLRADDVAGISDIYPATGFRGRTGSISGRVTKGGGGVFGAHIVAMNPATGALVGNFSLSEDGSFVIAGLEPGPHVVRVEPLDDGDLESFFERTASVDLDFAVTFGAQLAIVPRGGSTGPIEIQVRAK